MKVSISALGKRECPRSTRLLSLRRVFAVSGPSIEVCNRLSCNVNFTYLTAPEARHGKVNVKRQDSYATRFEDVPASGGKL